MIRKAIRRFLVEEKGLEGAALVEFTILAPMLLIMSIYTMDFGLLFFNKIEMQNAAEAGAQWAIANGRYNTSDIALAAQNATKIPASQITVNSNTFCGCPDSTTFKVNQIATGVCAGGTTCSSGEFAGTYVAVTAAPTTTYHSFIAFGGVFGWAGVSATPNITSTSTVRIQ